MANRHFGKLADIWKHLPLAEILKIEHPSHYWESHAGSARYEMVDDAERRFGAQRFLEVSGNYPRLESSRYRQQLVPMASDSGRLDTYPGSPVVAMTELGSTASYLFCDTDQESADDLKATAARLGLQSQVVVANADGMSTLHEELVTRSLDGKVIAHLDPFDSHVEGPAGLSALDLAAELISNGVGLMYWYGYSDPSERAWALKELGDYGEGSPLWCGDMMVGSTVSEEAGGDLGDGTTPGTGFGIVLANVSDRSISSCQQLGRELAKAYEGAPQPNGEVGHLEMTVHTVR
jgi:23S rRNA A2030 N6-methylase RlmJ